MRRISGFLGLFLAVGLGQAWAWQSALYPSGWRPGYADAQGRFLQDFSYAGYHGGDAPLPDPSGHRLVVTDPSYRADNTGRSDATAAIQAALDDAANYDQAVVFLPSGTYRIAPPANATAALRIQGDHIVLLGEGPGKTFLFNSDPVMRGKTVIEVKARDASWWWEEGNWVEQSPATADIANGARQIGVQNPGLFSPGDLVVVRNDATERFIAELGMSGKWTPANLQNRALIFCRKVVAADPAAGTITVDVPIRYPIRVVDHARVAKLNKRMVAEVGLQDFSIGMQENTGNGLGDNDFKVEGTAAYQVHGSHAVVFDEAQNSWVRRVNSYAPPGNASGCHVVSNGILLVRSRFVTVQDCDWSHAQYLGEGGNGYLFTLQGNECLLRSCHAEKGRHNYDFGQMSSSGNVILDCTTKDGRLASDFHMHFSVANLIDNMTCDGNFLEAVYRPYGSPPIHGVTTTQSVFWNTNGLRYPPKPPAIVVSRQFGQGYVIGTRGPAPEVETDNFAEGIGQGETLEPRSLYLDQLARRQVRKVEKN